MIQPYIGNDKFTHLISDMEMKDSTNKLERPHLGTRGGEEDGSHLIYRCVGKLDNTPKIMAIRMGEIHQEIQE